jgi:hypothetical protein
VVPPGLQYFRIKESLAIAEKPQVGPNLTLAVQEVADLFTLM